MPFSSLSPLKATLRHQLKQGKALWRGDPFHYADVQDGAAIDSYPYQWSSSTTRIKQRSGLPNINENRLWNMQLAVDRMDGLILQPGQIFAFWQRVPQPTAKHGFRAGPTLVRGKLSTDLGGGLCQISTTLFNALLWANLEILERHNHSIDAHGAQRFFQLGQDAAVAYGYKDLVVRNASEIPLMLRLQISLEKAEVTAAVWGQQPMPMQVRVESTVLEELNPSSFEDMPGWRVETVRSTRPFPQFASPVLWQVTYRALDLYLPHVSVHHPDRLQPDSVSP